MMRAAQGPHTKKNPYKKNHQKFTNPYSLTLSPPPPFSGPHTPSYPVRATTQVCASAPAGHATTSTAPGGLRTRPSAQNAGAGTEGDGYDVDAGGVVNFKGSQVEAHPYLLTSTQ